MAEARFVELEGMETPCLLVCTDGAMPEELVVDYPEPNSPETRAIVYRLQPSSAQQAKPVYVEVFDE